MTRTARRVIFVNRVYWPAEAATAQLLTDLAEGLVGRGWEVHVIAAGIGDDTRHGVVIHRTGGNTAHGGVVSRLANYTRFLRAAAGLVSKITGHGDIVVAMTDPPQLATRIAAATAESGAAVVQWIQDIYPEILAAHSGRWLRPALGPLIRTRNRAWKSAARCVTVGEDMRRTLTEAGVSPTCCAVIPNWAPRVLADCPDAKDVAAVRRDWGLDKKWVVAYSGNLGRVHLFAPIIEAAASLRDDERIQFVFVGGGPRLREVRSAVACAQLSNVRFMPAQPRARLPAAMAAANVHLVTLRPGFEQLVYPSKLAGILAAGRPALFVGPEGSEIAGFLKREHCGLSFGPDAGAGLGGALRWLADDPDRAAVLGEAARRAYENHFTFPLALAAWESVLQSALA